jgi:hypothetical protein
MWLEVEVMKAGAMVQDALSHVEADAACGRPWSCACGACKTLRNAAPELLRALRPLVDFTEDNFRRAMGFTPKRELDAEVAQHALLAPAKSAIRKAGGK